MGKEAVSGEGCQAQVRAHLVPSVSTPRTLSVSVTSRGRGALSGHSSPKAFILHICTRTLWRQAAVPGTLHPPTVAAGAPRGVPLFPTSLREREGEPLT